MLAAAARLTPNDRRHGFLAVKSQKRVSRLKIRSRSESFFQCSASIRVTASLKLSPIGSSSHADTPFDSGIAQAAESARWLRRGPLRCLKTRRRRLCRPTSLALHGSAQNSIDAGLIPSPLCLQPGQHVGVQPNRQLLLGRWPDLRSLVEKFIRQRRDVGVIDLGILHPVKSFQVALDTFFAHGYWPFSSR